MSIAVLKLIYGDKHSPSRTLDLNQSDRKITMRQGGFGPGPGVQSVQWSGYSARRDGARRISSRRDNAVIELTYQMQAGSTAELAYWQREINRFANDAKLYEEDRQGQEVWLQYLWDTDLSGLPAPVMGQFYHYLRVYDIDIPSWPESLHGGGLLDSAITGIVARLTVGPFAEGLPQKAATGIGQLQLMDGGVLVADGVTNAFTNPSFGHGTWNTGWSVNNANLKAERETRPGLTRSLDSAAHLYNTDTSTDRNFTQTLTLTAVDYVASCYARRPDGAAITSADLRLIIQNSIYTTYYESIGDGWYFCHASATAAAVAAAHGVQVKAGREVIVDDFQIELSSGNPYGTASDKPSPFCAGHLIGCSWTSTAHASTSTRPNGYIKWTLENECAGQFTAAFWITAQWANTWPAQDMHVFDYYIDANNYLRVWFESAGDYFTLNKYLDAGNNTDNGSAQTISYGDAIHICIVQADTTCKVYVNGVEDISVAIQAGFDPDGTLALGSQYDGSNASDCLIDGFHLWTDALTAAEALALYTAEKEVKDEGGSIGVPPYFWTKDGDATVDNVDGILSAAAKDNWGIVGGVSGDVPAAVRYRIQPSNILTVWLARRATDEAFTPYDTLYLDFNTTANVGLSSGDGYDTDTSDGSGSDWYPFYKYVDEVKHVRGQFQVVGRYHNTGAAADVYPYFRIGTYSNEVQGDTTRSAISAGFVFYDFGDIYIDWPQYEPPAYLQVGLWCAETTAVATTWQLDFLQLLPRPCCRINAETTLGFSAGDVLEINGTEAWSEDSSQDYRQYTRWLHRGDDVTLEPNKYNYLWFIHANEGDSVQVTYTAIFAIYITPRFLLPGGPIA